MLAAAGEKLSEGESASDAALMEQLVRQETRALEHLYERYSRPVFSLVLRIVEHAASAEDVVQEVFLQLWRNAHRYQAQRGPLEPWLFTLARNRALDHRRMKLEKQRQAEVALDVHPADVASPNPEHIADRKQRAARVRKVMGSLPERQRRAIELAFFEGMTHSEVAAALQEPLGTVKSWIRTGLQHLREALGSTEPPARPAGEAR